MNWSNRTRHSKLTGKRLNAVNSELERRRTEVEHKGARLGTGTRLGDERRQDGRSGLQAARGPAGTRGQKEEVEAERTRLQAEREKFLAEIEQQQAEKAAIAQVREELDRLSAERSAIQAEIDKRKQAVDEEAEQRQQRNALGWTDKMPN